MTGHQIEKNRPTDADLNERATELSVRRVLERVQLAELFPTSSGELGVLGEEREVMDVESVVDN